MTPGQCDQMWQNFATLAKRLRPNWANYYAFRLIVVNDQMLVK